MFLHLIEISCYIIFKQSIEIFSITLVIIDIDTFIDLYSILNASVESLSISNKICLFDIILYICESSLPPPSLD